MGLIIHCNIYASNRSDVVHASLSQTLAVVMSDSLTSDDPLLDKFIYLFLFI